MGLTRVKGRSSHVWHECGCGKVFQVAEFVVTILGQHPQCRLCSPAPEGCPEVLWDDDEDQRKWRRCTLDADHVGRCEP